jgi:tyrosyl-tRNA synthetase
MYEQTAKEVIPEAPKNLLPRNLLGSLLLLDLLSRSSLINNAPSSKSVARSFVERGSVGINDEWCADPKRIIHESDLIDSKYVVLRVGRRKLLVFEFA